MVPWNLDKSFLTHRLLKVNSMPALYPYTYGEPLLSIKDVNLSFGNKTVLKNVSAEIRKINRPGQITGQVVGILGPSGRGKTCLFKIIAGLSKPTSGAVYANSDAQPVQAGEVGMVHQDYPLFNHRTVMSNLMLAASVKNKPDVAKDNVNELLEMFKLTALKNAYPALLSGGQRQRVAILQQILCSSHYLLMDEPFSGLDIVTEDTTLQLILKVANLDDLNTVIVVSHDVSAVVSVCDHIWMLGHIPGDDSGASSIVKTYDLIESGLCWAKWEPMAATTPAVAEFIRELKQEFFNL
jgi:ABC-type nitrate/sulfonate/bicarbonate transport system ATPase subunit